MGPTNNYLFKTLLSILFYFLKRLKWNILPTKNVFPSTRRTKEKTTKSNSIYKMRSIQEKQGKKKLPAYVKHSERTKPPTMVIEGNSRKFRLQPPKG